MFRLFFQWLSLVILQPIPFFFFPQMHSSLKTIFMLWLRFQISAASQSSHPDWVVAKIYLQTENYTWDSTSHERSVLFTSASLKKNQFQQRKKSSDVSSQKSRFHRVGSGRAERCCSGGCAAEEWCCQLVAPSSSSAAAESCTCACIPPLIWSGFTIILLEKVFYPFHSLRESKWRKAADKEMLMVTYQKCRLCIWRATQR